jgi:two-component system phosphate regulon sensor histidine kinase PhoR
LQTAAMAQQIRLEELGGQLSIQLDATNPLVSGDPVHLSNIVYNLMDNAIKYTEEIPHLKVRTRNHKGCIFIDIEDNGIGINRRQQRLIFDKFYRVSTGDIHNVKGFGLGLYYVQTMLKAQKGKINVKSEKGKGSIFTLQLPSKKI